MNRIFFYLYSLHVYISLVSLSCTHIEQLESVIQRKPGFFCFGLLLPVTGSTRCHLGYSLAEHKPQQQAIQYANGC